MKYIAFLIILIFSVKVNAKITEIKFITSGILYDTKMSNAFVEIGDTVRFTHIDGVHSIKSTSVPAGATQWNFTLDISNTIMDIVINTEGWYDFIDSNNSSFGKIVCINPSLHLRYFEFCIDGFPSSENIIAATSDKKILQVIDSLLQLPKSLRLMHIKGLIGNTNGGFNYNWDWHFIKSKWKLAQYSEEVCDGWPTFVNNDISYWVDFLGYFCPWASVLNKEIYPVEIKKNYLRNDICIYPNPVKNFFNIKSNYKFSSYEILNYLGLIVRKGIVEDDNKIFIHDLNSGIYVLKVTIDKTNQIERLQIIVE